MKRSPVSVRRAGRRSLWYKTLALRATAARRRTLAAQPDAGGRLFLDAAFLVASRRSADFSARAASLARPLRADGLNLQLTGPWPPYSFVERFVSPRDARRKPAKARPSIAHTILDSKDDLTVLDVVDNLLNKGVVVNGDVVLGVAGVDLVYLRLSALLSAIDRVTAGAPAVPGRSARSREQRRPKKP